MSIQGNVFASPAFAAVVEMVSPLRTLIEMSLLMLGFAGLAQWLTTRHRAGKLISSKDTGLAFLLPLLNFAFGTPEDDPSLKKEVSTETSPRAKPENSKASMTTNERALSLVFSFVGLQASFLVWGVMQERLMTTPYGTNGEKFPSASVLVLSNRTFAIVFSGLAVVLFPSKKSSKAPFVAYSFAAVANTLSSFAQYESLRFLSFPMATVVKSSKLVPVMLMGMFVHGQRYSMVEYVCALVITTGVVIFALESGGKGGVASLFETSQAASLLSTLDLKAMFPGAALMFAYLAYDSFTSNWQNHLLVEYKISSFECMFGINVWSAILGLSSMANADDLSASLHFMALHPSALRDVLFMSLSSAIGQLFIYRTIDRHGPVVFTVISITRQLLSILLSSIMFGHLITPLAWAGVATTFCGILANNFLVKKARRGAKPKSA